MYPKKNIMMISILTILLAAVVISGCTTTTTGPTATPAAGGATTAPGGAAPSGAPKVSTSGQTMTISGSQEGQFTMTMEKAGYLVSVKSKSGYVGMTTPMMGTDFDLIPFSAASLEPSGWYEQQNIQKWNSAGDNTFKIKLSGKTSDPYTIEWTKLPSGAAAASPPQTYSGKGQKIVGPVKLNAGTATFTMSCPDAKEAGFGVVLFNADTGATVATIGYNVESGKVTNSYSATKTPNIAEAGNYYIQITANSAAGWEVTVSQ